MLDKAVAYYQAHGRKDALEAFNKKHAAFLRPQSLCLLHRPDRKLVADGEFREFIGQSADIMKDASGKPLGRAFWDIAQKDGQGEMHYHSSTPSRSGSSRKSRISRRRAKTSAASGRTSRNSRPRAG